MKKIILLSVSLLLLLTGCVEYRTTSFKFSTESEHWTLTDYIVKIENKKMFVGGGELKMNDVDEFYSNYFSYETHMIINGKDEVIHSESFSGEGINIAEKTIGTLEGETILNKDGKAIRPGDIHQIYMVIEWHDPTLNEDIEERINLYDREKR